MNLNSLEPRKEAWTLFVDMNSFFASCEQQVNYWLRNRPVGVCVYTGKHGCIIAPSMEAKKKGIKTGMRLSDAMVLCPDLVPIETHPSRYREFHVKIMKVLKKYSEEVIAKSIDEAVVSLQGYHEVYGTPENVAKLIKSDIKNEVGEWLTCSIGIAPNAFLAKLASDLQKPDGLVSIRTDNIDEVLKKLSLIHLPGIGKRMAMRMEQHGIRTPLDIRYADPEKLKRACNGIVGFYWHCRLNFKEVDMTDHDYRSMQAMRQVSAANRRSENFLTDLFHSLCMTLEKRMVKQGVFCREVTVHFRYEDNYSYTEHLKLQKPMQDGGEMTSTLKQRMKQYSKQRGCEEVINNKITMMSVSVAGFINSEMVQYGLFEEGNSARKDKARKVMYDLKEKFGADKLMKAAELQEHHALKDVIGFGSVKDLFDDKEEEDL
jgi:DNA polymerase-4